jgi:hypothetical protein
MKNLFIVLIFSLAITRVCEAQQLMVKSGSRGLYLDHTVIAKEGLFSIGRMYNVHPKSLASYNNLDVSKGLNIGQVLQVPLTDTNFSQTSNKGVPVYYAVGEKEGLFKVSNANNKVSMQSLRQWNKLSSDNLPVGSRLIVGFLTSAGAAAAVANLPKEEPQKPAEQVVKADPPKDKPVTKPVVTADTAVAKKEQPKTEIKEQVVKSEPVADKPVAKEEVKKADQPEEKAVVKEDAPKPATTIVKQDNGSSSPAQGYFKPSFDQQVKQRPVSKNETVTASIFKTSNGLQDAKYYLLIDGVSAGTIVRVINPENNKMVYAKVLGEMSGIRQNQGLNIRISSIAASTLGIMDTDKFIVKINY